MRNNNSWDTRSLYRRNISLGVAASTTIPPKPEPKKVEMKVIGDTNKLFSNVGVEPTFYPNIRLPKELTIINHELEDYIWDNLSHNLYDNYKFRRLHSWLTRGTVDGNNLEVPSPHHYQTANAITADFSKLCNVLKKHIYEPSSVIDRSVEGGCHINFNLADRSTQDNEFVTKFMWNLVMFLNANPALVWSLLAPEDNQSSKIVCSKSSSIFDLSKGQLLTARRNNWSDNKIIYTELRFFMMPRTVEEFKFHIVCADKILKYVWNKTVNHGYFNFKNNCETLKQYKFAKAEAELKNILPKIGIKYADMLSFDKIFMLKQRFKYGKTYLV